jgi:hypothetical protein
MRRATALLQDLNRVLHSVILSSLTDIYSRAGGMLHQWQTVSDSETNSKGNRMRFFLPNNDCRLNKGQELE